MPPAPFIQRNVLLGKILVFTRDTIDQFNF